MGLINKILPEKYQINVGNLEQFKSAGKSIADEITEAVAKTEPSMFRKTVVDSWDAAIKKQKEVVEALNKRDFGEDVKKIEDAGVKVSQKIEAAADTVAKGGEAAGQAIESAAAKLAGVVGEMKVAIGRTGASYEQQSTTSLEGVRARLRSQAEAMRNDTSFASVWSPNAKNPLLYGIQSELAAVERELAQRQAVASYASKFGEQAARFQYGDTIVNRALQDLGESNTRTASAVESIQRKLDKLLG